MASNPDFVQDYFFIEDVDYRDYLSALVRETCNALPQPKPKKKKNEINEFFSRLSMKRKSGHLHFPDTSTFDPFMDCFYNFAAGLRNR